MIIFSPLPYRYPGKTVNQVLLRWGIQNGYITIPKSSKPERIDENANIFDFEITADDMAVMVSQGFCLTWTLQY